jgi:hypothetical protein
LGCDYFCDKSDGTLCYGPKKYIGKIVDQYEKMFGLKPHEYTSPLEKGDQPEVDTSEELDEEGIKKYQTRTIGCLHWAISLGRFDIQTATMTMSCFLLSFCSMQRTLGSPFTLNESIDTSRSFLEQQYESGSMNQTLMTYLIKTLIGVIVYMEMYKNYFQKMRQSHLERQ